MLSGLYGFLASLPELADRREAIQARRQVADRDILKRFGSHWLHPSGSPHQSEHNQVQQALVDYFGLAFVRATVQAARPGRGNSAIGWPLLAQDHNRLRSVSEKGLQLELIPTNDLSHQLKKFLRTPDVEVNAVVERHQPRGF